MRELILASTSPYRRQLLESAGIAFRAESPGVDEREIQLADPVALATALARKKAFAVAARHPEALIIGADQVGYDLDPDGRPTGAPFGKPTDREAQFQRLRAMVGRRHALVTAVVLKGPEVELVEHETTVLVARDDLEADELRAYVDTGEGLGCAGGYAAEGRGGFLFERVDGDWSNVIGLPMFRLVSMLRRCGWRFR